MIGQVRHGRFGSLAMTPIIAENSATVALASKGDLNGYVKSALPLLFGSRHHPLLQQAHGT